MVLFLYDEYDENAQYSNDRYRVIWAEPAPCVDTLQNQIRFGRTTNPNKMDNFRNHFTPFINFVICGIMESGVKRDNPAVPFAIIVSASIRFA